MALEEVNESIPKDCQWIAPVKMSTLYCPRNLRGFEKTELLARTLATVHNFSRYVLRPLYHPCNKSSMCRKALNKKSHLF
jgi:hypothetical protein